MREELRELADTIILAGEKAKRLEKEEGVIVANFRSFNERVYVNLLNGIERVANLYALRSIFIEDGIVRAEDEGICFYQFVAPEDRKRVFEALNLL